MNKGNTMYVSFSFQDIDSDMTYDSGGSNAKKQPKLNV